MINRKILITTALCLLIAAFNLDNPGFAHSKPPHITSDNVKNFGATGNGKTDDMAAIQKAISHATAYKRGIFFPAGTYLHNNTLTFNGLAVSGAGSSSILKAGDNTNSAVILTGKSPSLHSIVISTAALTSGANLYLFSGAGVFVRNRSSNYIFPEIFISSRKEYG